MKKIFTLITFTVFSYFAYSQEGKVISDCTVTYDVSYENNNPDAQKAAVQGTVKTVYIKGSKSRSDLETSGFKQTTIFDAKTDSTIVLRETGNNKYISYLDNNKRKEKNRKFEGVQFSQTGERKTILGYDCIKVIAKLADGSTFNVYYTPAILPTNKAFEYQFKDLPGFVLEYETQSEDGKTKVKYSASKITLVPVPAAKFDIPKSGYRVL